MRYYLSVTLPPRLSLAPSVNLHLLYIALAKTFKNLLRAISISYATAYINHFRMTEYELSCSHISWVSHKTFCLI